MKKYMILLFTMMTWMCSPYAPAQVNREVAGGRFPNARHSTNYVKNYGAEKNVTYGIVNASSIVTRNTTTPLFGDADFSIDATATSQIVQFSVDTYEAGVKGNCEAAFEINGDASLYKAYVSDGTNKLTADLTLNTYTQRTPISLNFPCTTSARLYIESTGNGAAIKVDNVYTGLATNLGSVAQAIKVGSSYWTPAASCAWPGATGTSYVDFTADTDCNNPTLFGSFTTPSTKVPQVDLGYAAPGYYEIIAQAHPYNAAGTGICWFALTDESNNVLAETYVNSVSDLTASMTFSGSQNITVPTSKSYKLRSRRESGTGTCSIYNDPGTKTGGMNITVNYFPVLSQQIVSQNSQGWFIAANISGANPDLGTADVSSYTEITNASLTMTPAANSRAVGIMCSSTNAATAPTTSTSVCAAGSESVGLNFDIPAVGWYEVCGSFSHYIQTGASGSNSAGFQLVETATNAQTILQEGKNRGNDFFANASSTSTSPYSLCSSFYFSSVGTKGIRLMYEQDATATISQNIIIGDAAATAGQRDIYFSVKQITNGVPSPYVIGSIQSPYVGVKLETSLRFGGASEPSACTSTPCTIYSSDGNLSSVSRGSAGLYAVNFSPTLSGVPDCSCDSGIPGGEATMCTVYGTTAASISVQTMNKSGTNTDSRANVKCSWKK